MSIWQFYKDCWRRAVHRKLGGAKAWHGWAALLSAFLAACVNLWWPTMTWAGALSTWLPFLVFAAVFLGTLVRSLIVAPYEIYSEEVAKAETARAEVAALQKSAQPLLAFVDPGAMGATTLPRLPNAMLHRIAMQNMSTTMQVENIEVTLLAYTDMETGQRTAIARSLRDLQGGTTCNITPLATKYFDAALVRPDKSPPRLYFGPGQDLLSPHTGRPGHYQLEVQAISSAAPPLSALYLLELSSTGKIKLTLSR